MYPIIGICGNAGSGKDTVSDMIVLGRGSKIAFADKLKAMAQALYNLPPNLKKTDLVGPLYDLYNENAWDSSYLRSQDHQLRYGINKRSDLTYRELLQQLGDFVRGNDPAFFVRKAIHDAKSMLMGSNSLVVISDCRYRNEVLAIKELGGRVYRIERPGLTLLNHKSETELLTIPHFWFDGVILNDGTLEALKYEVRSEVLDNFWV